MRLHSHLPHTVSSSVTLTTLVWLFVVPLFGVHVHPGLTPMLSVVHAHDKQIPHGSNTPEIPKDGVPTSPAHLLFSGKLKKDDPKAAPWDLSHAITPSGSWMPPNAIYLYHVYASILYAPSRFVLRSINIRAPPNLT